MTESIVVIIKMVILFHLMTELGGFTTARTIWNGIEFRISL